MNPSDSHSDDSRTEPDSGSGFTPEVLARITGISIQTICEYQVYDIIRPAYRGDTFDDEAVRTLRRLEHIRATCEMNLSGLKLLAGLLNEVEQLRAALRERR